MLVIRPGGEPELADRYVRDLPDLLRSGDLLVLNDTRVIAARLEGVRTSETGPGARIEATLTRREGASRWRALARPARKLKVGDFIRFASDSSVCLAGNLNARVTEVHGGGEVTLAFEFHGAILDEAISGAGAMPLPPYIASRREPDERDRSDYQTVFARREGAVAAPTAGLHFTAELLEALKMRGVETTYVTLHVGPGTFLPVKVEDTSEHRLEAEWGEVSADAAAAIASARERGGRIVAVGTTALRLIEAATGDDGKLEPFSGETDLFITPGYRFRTAELLLTNFHLPRSTLFMLVSAFAGLDCMKRAYRHAVNERYRFYSYGDACLIHRAIQGNSAG